MSDFPSFHILINYTTCKFCIKNQTTFVLEDVNTERRLETVYKPICNDCIATHAPELVKYFYLTDEEPSASDCKN